MKETTNFPTKKDTLLAEAINAFDGTSIDEVTNALKDETLRVQYLQTKKALAEETSQKATRLLSLLKETEELELKHKAEAEDQKFLETEKRVLDSLSPAKRKKVETMRQY